MKAFLRIITRPECALAIALTAVILCSCAAPEYNIKRVAAIPAPYAPSRTGFPLRRGNGFIQLEANPFLTFHSIGNFGYSHVGDTGLLISTTQLGGSIYISPGRHFEMGLQYRYTPLDWMEASAFDVADFPSTAKSGVPQYGFGMRFKGPLDKDETAHLSGIIELNWSPIAEATYVLDTASGAWQYRGIEEETWGFPAVLIQFDQKFMDRTLDAYFFVGIEGSVTNTGFDCDSTEISDYSVEGTGICFGGCGFDITMEQFSGGAGAMFFDSPHYNPGGSAVSVFVRFGFSFRIE